jgi:hypothetical protein
MKCISFIQSICKIHSECRVQPFLEFNQIATEVHLHLHLMLIEQGQGHKETTYGQSTHRMILA